MPKVTKQVLLDYLKNRGLGFIKEEDVFNKISEEEIPTLLAAIQEVDRNYSVDIYNKRPVTPIAKETLDFLEKHQYHNVVAGYYYHWYQTTQPQTWDETNSSRSSLAVLGNKNLAVYFLLAEITLYRLNDKTQAAIYCKLGLEKLAGYLKEDSGKVNELWNEKVFEYNVYGADNFNRGIFLPLQFLIEKSDPKYFNTKYTETLSVLAQKNQLNLISLTEALISRQKDVLGGGSAIFHNFLYNATRKFLEFAQNYTSFFAGASNYFKFSFSFVRLLSHPIFGDELLEKINQFKSKNNSNEEQKTLTELLEKIDQRSSQLLSLFEKSPELIQANSLEDIANKPMDKLHSEKSKEAEKSEELESDAEEYYRETMFRFM